MAEDYARTLKRRTLIALIATLISLVLLGAAMFWLWCSLFGPPQFMRKDNPSLTPQSAQAQLDAGATIYWQDTTYQVPPNSGLDQLLHTDQWTSTSAFQAEDADLVVHFGEFYELSLWSDGKAAFYDGYSGHSTKSYAYYAISTNVVQELIASLAALVPA